MAQLSGGALQYSGTSDSGFDRSGADRKASRIEQYGRQGLKNACRQKSDNATKHAERRVVSKRAAITDDTVWNRKGHEVTWASMLCGRVATT